MMEISVPFMEMSSVARLFITYSFFLMFTLHLLSCKLVNNSLIFVHTIEDKENDSFCLCSKFSYPW